MSSIYKILNGFDTAAIHISDNICSVAAVSQLEVYNFPFYIPKYIAELYLGWKCK